MPELDFVLLAEFARVEPTGLLTVVGAGYSQLSTDLPARANLHLVARLLLGPSDTEVRVRAEAGLRAEPAAVTVEAVVTKPESAVFVDDLAAVSAIVVLPTVLSTSGTYEVVFTAEGVGEKRLYFRVVDRSEA